jgi:predicted solute-binding protein
MQDVLGQIASRTGGLASSYATTAAQQQYNDYMAKLEDAARSQYADEKSSMLDNAQLAQTMSESDYQRYLDELSQKQTNSSEALNALYQLLGYQQDQDTTKYTQSQTAKTDAQNRIYDYLVNQGGSVGNLNAD